MLCLPRPKPRPEYRSGCDCSGGEDVFQLLFLFLYFALSLGCSDPEANSEAPAPLPPGQDQGSTLRWGDRARPLPTRDAGSQLIDQSTLPVDQSSSSDQEALPEDRDRDGDGIPDEFDNCPAQVNPNQEDEDGNGIGDLCETGGGDEDLDRDGHPNEADNCPMVFNPMQSDIDRDGIGDLCEPDRDGDGIPDDADPEPNEAGWPGRAMPNTVYAHTSGALFALDVKSEMLVRVGLFEADEGERIDRFPLITDIAIDRAGVLYAISADTLFICHPQEVRCRSAGTLPGSFNGLTWLPGERFQEEQDRLVGISNDGVWWWLWRGPAGFESEELGAYQAGDRSSGDAYSIDGLGTFASVKRAGLNDDVIVRLDLEEDFTTENLIVATGYRQIYGLAGWRGALFAFDAGGTILRYDFELGELRVVNDQGNAWWGAAVSTVLTPLNERDN